MKEETAERIAERIVDVLERIAYAKLTRMHSLAESLEATALSRELVSQASAEVTR